MFAALLALLMGKDLNWDYYNYHGYAAFDPFGARLAQDFFPAGLQGYLNRLAYLPFSLMDRAGWHSAAIGATLAAIQSLNFYFLYLIARELTSDHAHPRIIAGALALLAAASNVILQQLGSTFVDPITTPPVMAAVWIVIRYGNRITPWLFAGGLAGVAVALKLTNAPYALAVLMAALVSGHGLRRLHCCIVSGLGCALGYAMLNGVWSWRLYQEFGSPLFPLFNNIFKASAFPMYAVAYDRFIPRSLFDLLAFPFTMAEHRSWVYVESVSPDIRPAVLIVIGALAAGMAMWRRRPNTSPAGAARGAETRLWSFAAVALAAWFATSANGRYAVPLLLLMAPALYLAARSLAGPRFASVAILTVLILQSLLIIDVGNPRWAPNDWTPRWAPVAVPTSLKSSPRLYLSTSTSSESYLAAHVHPDSSFVNPIGMYSISNGGPGWDQFVALRDRFQGRTEAIFFLPKDSGEASRSARVRTMSGAIERLGLTLEPIACQSLQVNADAGPNLPYVWGRSAAAVFPREVLSCTASSKPPGTADSANRARVERLMNSIEDRCPKIFSPMRVQVEGGPTVYSRLYGKHDLLLMVDLNAGMVAYRLQRQVTDSMLGTVAQLESDLSGVRCRLPHNGARDISTLAGDAGR